MSALIKKLDKVLSEKDKTIEDQGARIKGLEAELLEANNTIAELAPYKGKYEEAISDAINSERQLDELRQRIEAIS